MNKDFSVVEKELKALAKTLNYESYSEIEVFEKYLDDNNYVDSNIKFNGQIKDYNFDGSNIVFCFDKKDFYHMVAIIDNVIYDKRKGSEELYVIKIYKRRN